MRLATCSYREFRVEMGVPIQTSNGKPRWKLPYALGPAWDSVMPDRRTIQMTDRNRFTQLYRRKLEVAGIETLRGDVEFMLKRYRSDTAVLLCFEVLSSGSWCHRSVLADWWREKTGEDVVELGGVMSGPPEPPPPGLF